MLADGGLEAVHSGESVHKTHLTVQHGAGLGEILDHFLSANSVIPLGERQKDRTVKLICMVHVSNCEGGYMRNPSRLDSLVVAEVIELVEVRKVAPDAFKLLLSDVAIPIRVKVFKYRLKK